MTLSGPRAPGGILGIVRTPPHTVPHYRLHTRGMPPRQTIIPEVETAI